MPTSKLTHCFASANGKTGHFNDLEPWMLEAANVNRHSEAVRRCCQALKDWVVANRRLPSLKEWAHFARTHVRTLHKVMEDLLFEATCKQLEKLLVTGVSLFYRSRTSSTGLLATKEQRTKNTPTPAVKWSWADDDVQADLRKRNEAMREKICKWYMDEKKNEQKLQKMADDRRKSSESSGQPEGSDRKSEQGSGKDRSLFGHLWRACTLGTDRRRHEAEDRRKQVNEHRKTSRVAAIDCEDLV